MAMTPHFSEWTMKLTVEGMTCDHCVRSITRAVRTLDEGADVHVDLARGTVAIAGALDPAAAKAAIEAEGYAVTGIDAGADRAAPRGGGSGCCGTCHT